MNIVFAKGVLETMDYFTDQMVAAAHKMNNNVYIIDMRDPRSYQCEEFFDFISSGQCAAFFFNQIGLGIMLDNQCIWKKYQIPVYDFVLDHPRNYADWFIDPICEFNTVVLDNNHGRFIRRFYPKIEQVQFCPNGGNALDEYKNYNERTIDVLYVGDCQKPVDLPAITLFNDGGSDFYHKIITTMIQNSMLTTEATIDLYLNQCEDEITDRETMTLHMDYAPYIENYVRRYFKQIGMRALNEAGVHVEIYGNGWEDPDYTYGDNIVIHDRVSSEECNRLTCDAKVALNFMPWFKDGSSERVFNNMLGGAVCLSDRSRYLTENYTDGKDIVFFDLDNPAQMAMDVCWLLDHPEEAARIAEAGYEKAKTWDTWESRFKSIFHI